MAIWYNPLEDGVVEAIHIYLSRNNQLMADLAFSRGGTRTICWNNAYERGFYADGIGAHTIIIDDRAESSFESYVKEKIIPY